MSGLISKLKRNKLIKNYIWVFLGQNTGAVFSMLSLIFTLRIISTYEYGSLVIIQTYCLLISNLFSLRTFNGVIKFVTDSEQRNDKQEIFQYINTGFFLDFMAGVISVIFGIILLSAITNLMGWDEDTVIYVNMYLPVVFFYPLLNGTSTGIMRKLGYFFSCKLNSCFGVWYTVPSYFFDMDFKDWIISIDYRGICRNRNSGVYLSVNLFSCYSSEERRVSGVL